MYDISHKNCFIFLVGRKTTFGDYEYLQLERIPWWKGGGSRHVFTRQIHEASSLTHSRASDYADMHNSYRFERNVSESIVLTFALRN